MGSCASAQEIVPLIICLYRLTLRPGAAYIDCPFLQMLALWSTPPGPYGESMLARYYDYWEYAIGLRIKQGQRFGALIAMRCVYGGLVDLQEFENCITIFAQAAARVTTEGEACWRSDCKGRGFPIFKKRG